MTANSNKQNSKSSGGRISATFEKKPLQGVPIVGRTNTSEGKPRIDCIIYDEDGKMTYPKSTDVINEIRLMNDLFLPDRHNRHIRPVRNRSQPLIVNFRMNLYQILQVHESQQTIKIYVWITKKWEDELLGWDPDAYGGIKRLTVPHKAIWIPDSMLFNSVDMDDTSQERKMTAVLRTRTDGHASTVTLMYPAIYEFTCQFYIRFFPFDTQTCAMMFGSWTNDQTGITHVVEHNHVLMESFKPDPEWRVRSFSNSIEKLLFSCCPEPWSMIHSTLVLQRKPLFYLINLVLPSAIIALVSVVGFFMPATTDGQRQEKVNLGITTLLAMAILLLMVVDSMPKTSNYIPIMGCFYISIIIVSSAGTLLTTVIIWLQGQSKFGRPVWRPLRQPFFKVLGPLLRVPARPELVLYWVKNGYTPRGIPSSKRSRRMYEATIFNQSPTPYPKFGELIDVEGEDLDEKKPLLTEQQFNLDRLMSVDPAFTDAPELTRREAVFFEWEHLCDVVDRLLLIITSLFIVFASMMIMLAGFFFEF